MGIDYLPDDFRISNLDERSQDLCTIHRATRRGGDLPYQDAPADDVGEESAPFFGGEHLREELLSAGLGPDAGVFC